MDQTAQTMLITQLALSIFNSNRSYLCNLFKIREIPNCLFTELKLYNSALVTVDVDPLTETAPTLLLVLLLLQCSRKRRVLRLSCCTTRTSARQPASQPRPLLTSCLICLSERVNYKVCILFKDVQCRKMFTEAKQNRYMNNKPIKIDFIHM